jgi:serine/threonine protein kinase
MTGKTPFRAKTSELIYDNIQDMNIQWLPAIRGSCLDLIQRLLVNNPAFRLGNRLGAPEIKMHPWFNTVNWKRLSMRQVIPPIIPNLKNPEAIELEVSQTGDLVPEFQEILEASSGAMVMTDPNATSAMMIDPFQDF